MDNVTKTKRQQKDAKSVNVNFFATTTQSQGELVIVLVTDKITYLKIKNKEVLTFQVFLNKTLTRLSMLKSPTLTRPDDSK